MHRLRLFSIIAALALAAAIAEANVGATLPFTSVEAESGLLSGGATVVYLTNAPTTPYSSPELEASSHSYVALKAAGQSVQVTNTTGQNITALNLRSCIPDAPTGGGITSTLDLYVNGAFRQAFPVSSRQNYCYEGTNYNGQTDKNPADGDPRDFWNDTHAFIAGNPVAPGDTIRFQVDSSNTASFYYIDVIDLEAPPAALTQPAGSVSVMSYGAQSNNIGFDNTAAFNNAFNAATHVATKTVWIPAGTFYVSAIAGSLNASGISIVGAGPWYSSIYRVTPANNKQGIGNIINAVSCTLANVLLDCNSVSRAGNNNDGAVDFAGTNWLVTNVWIQHVTSSFWCAGVNGAAVNCRTLSTWADGGNLNNVQSANGIGMNLVYSNNFVRGTGDDAMAVNSVNYNANGSTTNYYTIMSNIVYANNTAIGPWGGKCMGIYGGTNVLVANNLLADCPRYLGLGVMKFGVNGSPLYSARVVGNLLLRCGGNGYSQQQQGMMIGNGGDGQSVGTIENAYIVSNTIIDALYDGIGFSTSTNIVLEYNTVISPGLDGIAAGPPDLGSGVTGYATLNMNAVTGLNSGRSAYVNDAGGYVIGGIDNSNFTVPSPAPAPWLNADVGSVPMPGGATYSKDTFAVVGSGADIGGAADTFHYVYQSTSGDCSLSARVVTEQLVNSAAKAGVMIRNSLDAADLQASVLVTPGSGAIFEWRSAYGGETFSTTSSKLKAPCWVQLVRSSNTLSAFASTNGATWSPLGGSVTIPMSQNVLLGLAISSHTNAFCSAMIDNVSPLTVSTTFSAVHYEGDLIVNLQSSDLTNGASQWVNRTSDPSSVGVFTTANKNALNITNATWNGRAIKALLVSDTVGSAVQSVLQTPAEINGNSPVSAEAWIFATAVNQQNSCALSYGIQGGSGHPEEDREFNYSDPCCGGGVSGDFGSYDTPWGTPPATGAWHYLAWTYDGSAVRLYLDGELNAQNSPSSPLQTPSTYVGVGAGVANSGPNLGADAFQGYIAAARLESGVLTPIDIASNYALGPLGSATALAPYGLSAAPGEGQVVLTWASPGNASGYDVKRSTSASGPFTVIATNVSDLSYSNIALADGATYYYVVSGLNSAGESPDSAVVSARPVSLAPPVFNLALNGRQIQLSWSQDHTGWMLQAQTNSSGGGLGTNWVAVPQSALTNQFTIPVDSIAGSVFFRLVYP